MAFIPKLDGAVYSIVMLPTNIHQIIYFVVCAYSVVACMVQHNVGIIAIFYDAFIRGRLIKHVFSYFMPMYGLQIISISRVFYIV